MFTPSSSCLAWDRKLRTSSPQRHYHAQCRYELRQQTLDALIKGLPRCSHLRHCKKWYRTSGGVHGHRQNIHTYNQKWLQKQSRSKSHNAELFVVTVLTFLSFANSLRLGKVQCRECEKNKNLRTNYGRFLRCFDGWCHVWTDINQLFFICLSGTRQNTWRSTILNSYTCSGVCSSDFTRVSTQECIQKYARCPFCIRP